MPKTIKHIADISTNTTSLLAMFSKLRYINQHELIIKRQGDKVWLLEVQ
jgi:hypothetical protein